MKLNGVEEMHLCTLASVRTLLKTYGNCLCDCVRGSIVVVMVIYIYIYTHTYMHIHTHKSMIMKAPS